ncbi:hypothetical protein CLCR_03216 [Cladophialophora carrionii]|uniref:Uncharacterized protein n=1 Tax=Cladophialophora carrionii TaxID=86049 RepID=A0A1C1D2L0_9EURO|nr:hypothetical protein CLCR_03216 [Cladophialophora carrionii]
MPPMPKTKQTDSPPMSLNNLEFKVPSVSAPAWTPTSFSINTRDASKIVDIALDTRLNRSRSALPAGENTFSRWSRTIYMEMLPQRLNM